MNASDSPKPEPNARRLISRAVRLTLALSVAAACSPSTVTVVNLPLAAALANAPQVSAELSDAQLSRTSLAAGETATLTLTTKDADGRPLNVRPKDITVILNGGSSDGHFAALTPTSPGVYTSTFTARRAGTSTHLEVHIADTQDVVLVRDHLQIQVEPGDASLARSEVTVANSHIRAGDRTQVILRTIDSFGNPIQKGGLKVDFALGNGAAQARFSEVIDHNDGTYSADLKGFGAGAATRLLARIGSDWVLMQTPTVAIEPAEFSPEQSEIHVSTKTVSSGDITLITVIAKDTYGNRIRSGGETISFSFEGGSSTGSFAPTQDRRDGTYTTAFTGWRAGASGKVTAEAGAQPIGGTAELAVTPGRPDPSRSHLNCASSRITVGRSLLCTLVLKDAFDNPATATAPPTFEFHGGTSQGQFATPQNPRPGVYTSVFTPTKEGQKEEQIGSVAALINGTSMTFARPRLQIIFPSTTLSQLSVDEATISSGSDTLLRFQAKDEGGQDLEVDGLDVRFQSVTSSDGSSVEIGAVQDRGRGLYVATVTGLRSGKPLSFTAKIAGRIYTGENPLLIVQPVALAQAHIEEMSEREAEPVDDFTTEDREATPSRRPASYSPQNQNQDSESE